MQKLKYNLWFGTLEKDLKISENFESSFLSAVNHSPLPFNLSEFGMKLLGKNYYRILRKVAIEIAEKRIKEELGSDEKYVIALVKALDGVEEAINIVKEKRDDLKDIRDTILGNFEDAIKELEKLRDEIEKEINATMHKIAPNLTEIAGYKIGAKLIEKFGSLKKLAFSNANKIQIAGAEKSLYKALTRIKKGKEAKIPKHGIIFLHSFVRSLPKKKRGKMARFLASKISIASKIDYFRGELEEGLFESLKRKFEELRRK
ncbi:MAG: RNA-processing protein [Archaeoglobaceae archaeon]